MQVAYWNPCFKMCSCRKEISASNAAQFCPGLRKPVSHHFGHHIKGSVTFKEDSSMTNYMYIVNSSNIVQWTACEHVICWWKWSYVWPTWNFLLLFPCLVKTYQSLQVMRIKKIITTYRESCCLKNSPVSIRSSEHSTCKRKGMYVNIGSSSVKWGNKLWLQQRGSIFFCPSNNNNNYRC